MSLGRSYDDHDQDSEYEPIPTPLNGNIPTRDRKLKSKSNKSKPRSHREHRDRDNYRPSTNGYHHFEDNTNSNPNKKKKKKQAKSSKYSKIINENIIAKKQLIEQLPNRKKLVIIAIGDNPLPSHAAFDFIHCKVGMERKVMWKHFDVMVLIVPTNTNNKKKEIMLEACKKAKKINHKLFICIIDIEASESAVFRSKCFRYGANMVTNDHHSLKQVLNIIGNKGFNGRGTYTCPYCQMLNLTEDELWHHVPLYHVNEKILLHTHTHNNPEKHSEKPETHSSDEPSPEIDSQTHTHVSELLNCPICGKEEKRNRNFLLHLRNAHGPVHRGEIDKQYRDGILTHAFALVVVRRPSDNKFLVVQEASNSGFWLPGGRVEAGETLIQAALRETKEEAGINIDIKGILKIEHSTYAFDERKKAYNRMRIIFYAEPCDEKELPKSIPNYNSAGATFIDIAELDQIQLRADEPREWFNSLTQNFYYHSLDILSCWKHDHTTGTKSLNNSKSQNNSVGRTSPHNTPTPPPPNAHLMHNSKGSNGKTPKKSAKKRPIKRSKTTTGTGTGVNNNNNNLSNTSTHKKSLKKQSQSQKNIHSNPSQTQSKPNIKKQNLQKKEMDTDKNNNNKSTVVSPPSSPPQQLQQSQSLQSLQQSQQPLQHQQVTYMIAPSMMYQPFIPPNMYYQSSSNNNLMYNAQTQQRQSLQLQSLQQQLQMEPNGYCLNNPYYSAQPQQYYQHNPQLIYAAAPNPLQSDIQIANFHTNRPNVELKKMNNENNARNNGRKKSRVTVTQSDSLMLRKRGKHRRSLSNTLPAKNTLHSHFHSQQTNTTPPPGPIYSDQLNSVSAQRGIIGGNHSNRL